MTNFKDLKVWQKSRTLVKDIYIPTARFPENEKFGLISQFRRAAISVPTNIAEGSARGSGKDFLRFLDYSFASCAELESLIYLSNDLDFLLTEDFEEILPNVIEVKKMLMGLKKGIKI